MSIRALVLGLLLGLVISAGTHFNDAIIRQTFLIGNSLPPIVFGGALILLLAVNPLLKSVTRPLGAGELALIIAMGLAVCAWPGSNLLRVFPQLVSMTPHYAKQKPSWKATRVYSYLPGGSSELATGYVTDWSGLVDQLVAGAESGATRAEQHLWHQLDSDVQTLLRSLVDSRSITSIQREAILDGLNAVIRDHAFYQPQVFAHVDLNATASALLDKARPAGSDKPVAGDQQIERLNRALLVSMFRQSLRPPPDGQGVLVNGGRSHPEVDPLLLAGSGPDMTIGLGDIPWRVWWPTLRLWLGLSLAVGVASICMMIIVHPQWYHRELLQYPTVRFVEEVTRGAGGRRWPDVAGNRLFWIALGTVAAIHLLNGLNAWFGQLPHVNLRLDLSALGQLFPHARQVNGWNILSFPQIFFSVIGFGFFINARVSLSLGISLTGWIVVGAAFLAMGSPLESGRFQIDAEGTALRFGAYLAMTAMIFYFGRRHYLGVAAAAMGIAVKSPPARSTVWAARIFVASCICAVYLLMRYADASLLLSLMLLAIVLIVMLVLARVNADTGLFYAQPDFVPYVMMAGIMGIEGIGPEMILVLAIASAVLLVDPREALSPFIMNGLAMTDRLAKQPPGRSVWPIGAMVVVGLVVATVVTLVIQYNLGTNLNDGWVRSQTQRAVDLGAQAIRALDSKGLLAEVTGSGSLGQLAHLNPSVPVIAAIATGAGLTLVCSIARIRLPWWPIHPVLFVVWGTYPANHFAFSFLLAAAFKSMVIRVGGERLYHQMKPLAVGMIAGELLMIILWSIVGLCYWLNTGITPQVYRILPG